MFCRHIIPTAYIRTGAKIRSEEKKRKHVQTIDLEPTAAQRTQPLAIDNLWLILFVRLLTISSLILVVCFRIVLDKSCQIFIPLRDKDMFSRFNRSVEASNVLVLF